MQDVAQLVKQAEQFGQQVCAEKGLQVRGEDTPTEHQRGIAALHAREDAAACFLLITHVLRRQQTIQRWLYFVTFLLVCVLANLR